MFIWNLFCIILFQTLKINFFLLFNIEESKNFTNYLSFFLKMLEFDILLHMLNYVNNNNIASSSTDCSCWLIYRINKFNILIFRVSIKFFCNVICSNNSFIFFRAIYASFLYFVICVSVSFIIIWFFWNLISYLKTLI